MAWLVYLIHSQFGLPKTMRAGRKKDIGNTAAEIVQAALIKHYGDFGFAAFRPAHLVRQSAALLIDIRPFHISNRTTAVAPWKYHPTGIVFVYLLFIADQEVS